MDSTVDSESDEHEVKRDGEGEEGEGQGADKGTDEGVDGGGNGAVEHEGSGWNQGTNDVDQGEQRTEGGREEAVQGHPLDEESVIVIEDDTSSNHSGDYFKKVDLVQLPVESNCRREDGSGGDKESTEGDPDTSDGYTTVERLAEASGSSRSLPLSSRGMAAGRVAVEHVVPLRPFELLSAISHAQYDPHTAGLDRCDQWLAQSLPEVEEGEILEEGTEFSNATASFNDAPTELVVGAAARGAFGYDFSLKYSPPLPGPPSQNRWVFLPDHTYSTAALVRSIGDIDFTPKPFGGGKTRLEEDDEDQVPDDQHPTRWTFAALRHALAQVTARVVEHFQDLAGGRHYDTVLALDREIVAFYEALPPAYRLDAGEKARTIMSERLRGRQPNGRDQQRANSRSTDRGTIAGSPNQDESMEINDSDGKPAKPPPYDEPEPGAYPMLPTHWFTINTEFQYVRIALHLEGTWVDCTGSSTLLLNPTGPNATELQGYLDNILFISRMFKRFGLYQDAYSQQLAHMQQLVGEIKGISQSAQPPQPPPPPHPPSQAIQRSSSAPPMPAQPVSNQGFLLASMRPTEAVPNTIATAVPQLLPHDINVPPTEELAFDPRAASVQPLNVTPNIQVPQQLVQWPGESQTASIRPANVVSPSNGSPSHMSPTGPIPFSSIQPQVSAPLAPDLLAYLASGRPVTYDTDYESDDSSDDETVATVYDQDDQQGKETDFMKVLKCLEAIAAKLDVALKKEPLVDSAVQPSRPACTTIETTPAHTHAAPKRDRATRRKENLRPWDENTQQTHDTRPTDPQQREKDRVALQGYIRLLIMKALGRPLRKSPLPPGPPPEIDLPTPERFFIKWDKDIHDDFNQTACAIITQQVIEDWSTLFGMSDWDDIFQMVKAHVKYLIKAYKRQEMGQDDPSERARLLQAAATRRKHTTYRQRLFVTNIVPELNTHRRLLIDLGIDGTSSDEEDPEHPGHYYVKKIKQLSSNVQELKQLFDHTFETLQKGPGAKAPERQHIAPKEPASLNLATRYATPCSLPPAFGIEPAHKWTTGTSTGSSYAPSDHTYAPSVSGYESGARSVLNWSPLPAEGNFRHKTPLSTTQWAHQASELALTPTRFSGGVPSIAPSSIQSNKGPPSVVSYLFDKPQPPRQRKARIPTTPPNDEPDPNEYLLQDGDFDVDGRVSSSEGEQDDILEIENENEGATEDADEDSVRYPVSKYIDNTARETRDSKKRKRTTKKNKASQRRISESDDSDADYSDYTNKKLAKRVKATPSPTKKVSKPNKKALVAGVKRRTPVPGAVNPLKKW
ncbi:unnamed protein product, partial [Rhizoctonia solani]